MNFRRILSFVALAWALPWAGCAATPRGVVVTKCVSDPLTESLHCVDPLGSDQEVPWVKSANFICSPPDMDQIMVNETRLK